MDVVFAVMPFADVGRPALGVGLLSAEARAAGFSTAVEYCNIALAEVIGPELYQWIASSLPPDLLLGEWFFADEVFITSTIKEALAVTTIDGQRIGDGTVGPQARLALRLITS